ncbi:pterin-4-alpha-carbinolamine dehydratase 2, mitochondrial [Amaranthus tricolor]|uniref:pterin-4-alpha-carbinolamine dehydratase 2, mitochondrial n=1 Tax=Amaranthus tricolor TaxID=29722 RepID=UPI00258FB97F|nr:pterin-4-alpha-carbinolamine dehydratase 2, mitochondrial [Amaranthus tricolor]
MSGMLLLRRLPLGKPKLEFAPVFQFLSRLHGCSSTPFNGMLQNNMELLKSRKGHHEFRTFCTVPDLAAKHCVPCDSKDMRPMNEELAYQLIAKVPEWNLVNEEGKLKLSRSWKVKSFTKGLEFFQIVANVAEAEGHHPDLHLVGWNNVTVEIWTHSVGGLTENDFILAAKISALDLAHLQRIKPK